MRSIIDPVLVRYGERVVRNCNKCHMIHLNEACRISNAILSLVLGNVKHDQNAAWGMNRMRQKCRFVCPDGKNYYNALCPKCDKEKTCRHEGKHYMNACGCKGTSQCICGWNEDWCFSPGPIECPYCGRTVDNPQKKKWIFNYTIAGVTK